MKLIAWTPCPQIEAYTTTRIEGYSTGDLAGLNLSFNVMDDPMIVLKNRTLLANYLHTDFDHMVATKQTHSTRLKKVSLHDGGKGIYDHASAFDQYDAMYTRDKNLFLLSFHADCTPVLLYSPDQELICEIHSGWKGNVNEITNKVMQTLIHDEHCDPKQMYAYIGPSIEYERFEVGQDVIDLIDQMSFDARSFYTKKTDGKYLFNAKGLVKHQLLMNGVLEKNITVSSYCTIKDNHLFYSFRKNKKCGRNVTMIRMK